MKKGDNYEKEINGIFHLNIAPAGTVLDILAAFMYSLTQIFYPYYHIPRILTLSHSSKELDEDVKYFESYINKFYTLGNFQELGLNLEDPTIFKSTFLFKQLL